MNWEQPAYFTHVTGIVLLAPLHSGRGVIYVKRTKKKMTWIFTLCVAAVIIVVSLAVGQPDTIMLTGVAGQSCSLITGLKDIMQVVLYSGSNVLLNFDNGTLVRNESERFQMKDGSVIISHLNLNDSREYTLDITYRNSSVDTYKYELNVTQADPITPTTGPPQNITTGQRNHHAVYVSFGLFGLVCIVLCCLCSDTEENYRKMLLQSKKWGQRCDLMSGFDPIHLKFHQNRADGVFL